MTSAMKDCPYQAETSERRAWAEGHGHAVAGQNARREEEVAGPAYATGFADGIEAALANIEDLILDPNDPLRAYLDRDLVVAALGYAAQAVAALHTIEPHMRDMLAQVAEAAKKSYDLNTKSRSSEIQEVRQHLLNAHQAISLAHTKHPPPGEPTGYFAHPSHPGDGVRHIAALFEGERGKGWADWGNRGEQRLAAGEELARRLGAARAKQD